MNLKAEKIIDKLGGKIAVSELLGISKGAVYLWFYAKPKGCGGQIPPKHAIRLCDIANSKGISCTIKDILGE